jgi:hypothetical protein
MPLRKSPVRTPSLLAANRANCLKSTGPRTPRGKARVCLNALKHGRHARRLPEKLARAGYFRELALYSRIHSFIVRALQPHGAFEQGVAAALAAKACCLPRLVRKTKPECSTESVSQASHTLRTRIAVKDYRRRIGLVFWVQRRGSPATPLRRNQPRCAVSTAGLDPYREPTYDPGLAGDCQSGCGRVSENQSDTWKGAEAQRRMRADRLGDGVRCWVHRLRKPRLEERIRYSLDHAGIHRPELEAQHWRQWPELCRLWGTPNVPADGHRRW